MTAFDATSSVLFTSAVSDAPATDDALRELIPTLADALDGRADLVLAFATPHHGNRLDIIRQRVRAALDPRVLLACTNSGVIGARREIESGPGLSILAGRLPGVRLHAFQHDQLDWPHVVDDPAQLGASVRGDLDPEELQAVLLLADPFSTPLVKLLPAFNEALPGIPIGGAMLSGATEPRRNRLLLNDVVLTDGAIGLAIGGNIDVHSTVSQGCRPIGKPLVITKAKRHIVQELGGRKALDVVREMAQDLPESDQTLIQAGGLQIGRVIHAYKSRFGPGDFLVRGLVAVDENAGYIAIGDPQVRVGQTIQFQVRDEKSAANDFELMLLQQQVHGGASGALLFSCHGRGTNLYKQPNRDVAMVEEALGSVPMAGCFAVGEIGPLGDTSYVHGNSASLMVFRSAATPAPDPV